MKRTLIAAVFVLLTPLSLRAQPTEFRRQLTNLQIALAPVHPRTAPSRSRLGNTAELAEME